MTLLTLSADFDRSRCEHSCAFPPGGLRVARFRGIGDEEPCRGTRALGDSWPCIHGFSAIVTNPRIYVPPSTTDELGGGLDRLAFSGHALRVQRPLDPAEEVPNSGKGQEPHGARRSDRSHLLFARNFRALDIGPRLQSLSGTCQAKPSAGVDGMAGLVRGMSVPDVPQESISSLGRTKS